jgi:hypothetical protein
MGTGEKEPQWMQELKRIGAVATALTAIVGLFFLLFPKSNPSSARSATLKELQVEPIIDSHDIVVHFQAQIVGHQGEVFQVRWGLIDPNNGMQVTYHHDVQTETGIPPAPQLGRQPAAGWLQLKPNTQSELLPGEIVIEGSSGWKAQTVRIEIELRDYRGEKLLDHKWKDFSIP